MRRAAPPTSRVCVVVAPACAGRTSSLETTRSAWENPGKTVLGLVLTGKAADVMEGEGQPYRCRCRRSSGPIRLMRSRGL
ncbi:AAA family ATPase [Corynebacterium antarcticum]|uniref:AAA family ATPase n=1 Tax=Corynebacterium antarcticum TaxID=2800405 RepID=UPI003969DD6F